MLLKTNHSFSGSRSQRSQEPSQNREKDRLVLAVVWICFGLDLLIPAADVATRVAIHQQWLPWTDVVNVGAEANIPTWYQSAKLLLIGIVLCMMIVALFRERKTGASGLLMGALMFIGLSMDETGQIHERLGHLADTQTTNARFVESGLWPFVCVPPFIVALYLSYRAARALLTRETFILFAAGLGILMAGAVGMEMVANLVDLKSKTYTLCVISEETLEMFGTTTILWGAIRMAQLFGLRLSLEPQQIVPPMVAGGTIRRQ